MNCGETKELIQLYLDNELDARSALAVQQYLDSCPPCSRQLNAFLFGASTPLSANNPLVIPAPVKDLEGSWTTENLKEASFLNYSESG